MQSKIRKIIIWIFFCLLSFLVFYFGVLAISEYFGRWYLLDFELFSVLWLFFTVVLISMTFYAVRRIKKMSKIVIYFLVFGPLVLLLADIVGFIFSGVNSNGFKTKVSVDEKIVELAPPGPGFPVKPLDFPGNSVIPWLGWVDGISWDGANEACSHLDKNGTVLMSIQQNLWRLPTLDESRGMIKDDGILSPNYGVWWTATTKKYENCAAAKDGQCHIIFSLITGEEIKTAYVPRFQGYRCVRNLK